MANHVSVWIEVMGTTVAQDEFEKIVSIFDTEVSNVEYGDTQLLSKLMFDGSPLVVNDPRLGGAKWAFIEEADGSRIQLTCGWDPAFGIAEVIFKLVSKCDPDALIEFLYEDEAPNFVGASIIGNVEGSMKRSDAWLDTSEWEVTQEHDDNEDDNPDAKTWDDVYEAQRKCARTALANFKKGKFQRFSH
jgi:hypothetical protein